MPNYIMSALSSAQQKAQYNVHAKNILSSKIVLSWILYTVVEECREYSLEQIRESIGNDIQISTISLEPGLANAPNGMDKVAGDNVVDEVAYEGVIAFDIRFHMYLNQCAENIRLLLDVEAQKKYDPGYQIVTRGIFYAARMISAQKETEFTESSYDDIKKVYSIWICMNAPDCVGNALSIYRFHKEDILPGIIDNKPAYDKIVIAIIAMNEKAELEEKSLHHLLSVLFSNKMTLSKKKETLAEIFEIDTRDSLGKEMDEMCNLADLVEEKGIEKGEERLNTLISRLIKENKMEDLKRATASKAYREQLYKKYKM